MLKRSPDFWVSRELRGVKEEIRRISEEKLRCDRRTLVIKENKYRTIFMAHLPFIDFPVLIKAFHFPTISRTLKGHVAPYAKRELWHAWAVRKRGILTAKPLFLVHRREGYRIKESFLAYRFLEGSTLHAILSVKEALPYFERLRLMRAAGNFSALLHNKGIVHGDFHAGNLLVRKDMEMVLLDVYPLRFVKQLDEKQQVETLANMVASLLPLVGKMGVDEFLDGYREVSLLPLRMRTEDKVLARQEALQRRREKSRSKRCMKNSSEFYQYRAPGIRIAARRELGKGEILTILKDFRKTYRDHPENVLKNAPESVIVKVEREREGPVCVKWYRKRGFLDRLKEWVRGGRALRAWKGGNGLLARGIPVAKPLAMVRRKEGGYLIMEVAEGVELDRMLYRLLRLRGAEIRRKKRRLANALGRFLGQLHKKGIFHRDLKTCNIMMEEKGAHFGITLLDYDHVDFRKKISKRAVIKNLVQINRTVPRRISRSLRFRFLSAYKEEYPDAIPLKDLFRMVWKASSSKSILYVTDDGDRIESW